MENNKKSFPEELNDAILAYRDDPHEDSYCRLLCCVLDGIALDVSIPIPADMDFERQAVRPRFQESRQGETGLVALTDPDGEKYPYFANVKLRAVLHILLNEETWNSMNFGCMRLTRRPVISRRRSGSLWRALSAAWKSRFCSA